jgi:hypothetical protein
MTDRGEETVTRLTERHRIGRHQQPAIISPLQGEITQFAVKLLLEAVTESAPMIAVLDPEAEVEGTHKAGLCRLTMSRSVLKAPIVSALETII